MIEGNTSLVLLWLQDANLTGWASMPAKAHNVAHLRLPAGTPVYLFPDAYKHFYGHMRRLLTPRGTIWIPENRLYQTTTEAPR